MTVDTKWQEIDVEKLTPAELDLLLKKEDLYVLDVRPHDFERDIHFIPGSFHCPLVFLSRRIAEIPQGKKIVVTDWAMKQSIPAAKYLKDRGGLQVLGVLKGGLERWEAEKYPVEERQPVKHPGPAAR